LDSHAVFDRMTGIECLHFGQNQGFDVTRYFIQPDEGRISYSLEDIISCLHEWQRCENQILLDVTPMGIKLLIKHTQSTCRGWRNHNLYID
jgi:hypothetical protein